MVNAQNDDYFYTINDERRVIIKDRKNMCRYKEIKINKIHANHEIVKIVSGARSEVQGMLSNHGQSLAQCLNLRRTINNEVEMEQKNQAKFPKHKDIDAENFLPQIEKWELRSRDLLAHRIHMRIFHMNAKSDLITQYVGRMEEYDRAFNYIKNQESCPRLDDIVETFSRFERQKEEILSNEYIIGNEIAVGRTDNNIQIKENNAMKKQLKDTQKFNIDITTKEDAKDKMLNDKHNMMDSEIHSLNDEFLEFKNLVYNSFVYFQKTILGKNVPQGKDVGEEKQFMALGQFDPLKLMGWFTQLTRTLKALDIKEKLPNFLQQTIDTNNKDISQKIADNSTTMDASGSIGKEYSLDKIKDPILAGLDDVDTNHGLIKTGTQTDFNDTLQVPFNPKTKVRRCSQYATPVSLEHDQNQKMHDFALKYGDRDDYLNANRMINLDVVRQKNYKTIVANANRNTFLRRSSSAYRLGFEDTQTLNKTDRAPTMGGTGGFTPRMTGGFNNTASGGAGSTLPVLKNFARSLEKKGTNSGDISTTTNTLRVLAGGLNGVLSKNSTLEKFSKQATLDKFNTTDHISKKNISFAK